MFMITREPDKDAAVLSHGQEVFHEAHKAGALSYRVSQDDGTEYGLLYTKNMDLAPQGLKNAAKGIDVYPDYRDYDETDTKYMDLALLLEHPYIFFESLNEYSVVLARLALAHTKAEVYFSDPFVLYFMGEHPRLHTAQLPASIPNDQILRADDRFITGALEGSFHLIGIVPLFHSVFFWQSLTDKPIAGIRCVRISMAGQSAPEVFSV